MRFPKHLRDSDGVSDATSVPKMITGQLSEPFQDLLLKKKKDYSMDDKTSYEVLHHIVGIYHLWTDSSSGLPASSVSIYVTC